MKNHRVILFSILIFPLIYLYPQNTWNPPKDGVDIDTTFSITISKNLPNYFLRYQEYNDSENAIFYFRVEIKKSILGKPFQIIQSESDAYAGPLDFDYGESDGYEDLDAILIDINFDGYKDLRFKKSEGSGPYVVNSSYEYYIFNPKRNRFELNEDLSDLMNPTPFPKMKIICSYGRNAFAGTDGTIEEYKWEGKDLVLLKSYEYKAVDDSCRVDDYYACNYKRLTEIYVNNKVIKSYSEIIKYNDIPEYHLRYW